MNDRNKSPLTCTVTSAVALWMDARGFKPVETEVPMPWAGGDEPGWIADVAGVICPTQTELIDLKLIPPRPRFRGIANMTKEFTDKEQAWREIAAMCIRRMTCLVEVKTARGDFLGDRKWKADIPTDMAYLAVPKGIIRQDEWPERWGILEFSTSGLRQLRPPSPRQAELEQQFAVTLAIAIRRDHHTRYARLREYRQEDLDRRNEEKSVTNLRRLADAVLTIARGERTNVEVALAFHGIYKPAPWILERLQTVWGVARRPDVTKVTNVTSAPER